LNKIGKNSETNHHLIVRWIASTKWGKSRDYEEDTKTNIQLQKLAGIQKTCIYQWGTYRISSPTAMTEATSKLLLCESTLPEPLPTALMEEENFFALPALSNLPSESKYAGLNFSLQQESLMDNNAFGTVSCMLPIEVYLGKEKRTCRLLWTSGNQLPYKRECIIY